MTTSQPSGLSTSASSKDKNVWRDLMAYWILGLCNNYGYVVMLSAAHDIIEQFHGQNSSTHNVDKTLNKRQCYIISTGAILLADVLPSLGVKIIMPFLPFWVHFRTFVAVSLSAGGFLLVAYAHEEWMALIGVIVTSASSGIGETTFLAYSSMFNKNVISTWSSGTGAAGIIGSLSYATLISLKISPRNTMLIMLTFPIIEALSFWVILRKPLLITSTSNNSSIEDLIADDKPFLNVREKIAYIRHVLKYMLPLSLVYFFEYFINQGLYELVYFENIFLDRGAQYRWLNAVYQVGVFISRSSVNIFQLRRIWLMAVFQFINVIYFLTEVIYFYTPNIWFVFVLVLWEGLLGGAAYVNTFYRMYKEITPAKRQFAMGMVVQSDAYGIALAGFIAIPVHNAICSLPPAIRKVIW